MTYKVAALYQFVSLPDFREIRDPLHALCSDLGIRGTLLLAQEGINGTRPVIPKRSGATPGTKANGFPGSAPPDKQPP